MNNKKQQYSCISTYETDECTKGPINIGGETFFINTDPRQIGVIIQELTDAQMELYGMGSGHVRYVGEKLMQHNAERGNRGKQISPIYGALTKKEIGEAVKSLLKPSQERVRV